MIRSSSISSSIDLYEFRRLEIHVLVIYLYKKIYLIN